MKIILFAARDISIEDARWASKMIDDVSMNEDGHLEIDTTVEDASETLEDVISKIDNR